MLLPQDVEFVQGPLGGAPHGEARLLLHGLVRPQQQCQGCSGKRVQVITPLVERAEVSLVGRLRRGSRSCLGIKSPERGGTQPADQSAMVLPWYCDVLGDGDRCRGHLLFYPNMKKLRFYFHLLSRYVVPCIRALFKHDF